MLLRSVFSFILSLFIICNSNATEIVASKDGYKLSNLELQAGLNLLSTVTKNETPDLETKKTIATKLLHDKIIEKLAKKEDLDKDPLLEIENRSILVNAYIKKHYDIEKIAKENYNKAVETVKDKKVYTISHIMLENKAEADKIYAQINKSGKNWLKTFRKLAKTKSTDKVTAEKNGFVGTASETKLPQDFVAQIKDKPTNTALEPFQTKLGYHIVIVEKSENLPIESYDNVKTIFVANAIQEQINKIAKEQTDNKEIEFDIK